ncbi:MAG: dephospho-CoA kinase [Acidobacteriota bacterium]|nr:dephospho-CoA kinase [Acidobacteriota bacterium]
MTGGLASGKSFVAAAFAELGCHVVEADALGHELMQPGTPAHATIVQAFGRAILTDAGTIDRQALASIVFADPEALRKLNAIVHPAVRELSLRRFAETDRPIGIYVAAILVETGAYRDFAKLIVTACAREQQIERALARPRATEADVFARLARQLPLKKKTDAADYIIDTGGTVAETLRQTKMVYEDLRRLAS